MKSKMSLLLASFVSAIIDWIAVLLQIRWLEYLFKPLTMILLILWFFKILPPEKPIIASFVLAGLVLSLFGDIFLMLPGNWFLAGLIAFLVGHVAYIIGFNSGGIQVRMSSLIIAVLISSFAVPIYLQLRGGLKTSGRERLILPVTLYVIVISIMFWSASTVLFREDWITLAGVLLTIGAGFFFFSDAILGWNRFVKTIERGNLIVIVTYHSAQYLISFGVLYRLGLLPNGLFG
jgi:uncharacterized membrane protein YhhN